MQSWKDIGDKLPAYTLAKSKNKKTGKIKFVIRLNNIWRIDIRRQELYDHFDPFRNRRIGRDMVWKFNTQEEAEHLLSLAILKGWL